MVSAYEIKKEICEIGRRIYMNGFVAANDGNISVKINDNEFYCTPTGVSKGFMTPDMIIKVDGQGNNCLLYTSDELPVGGNGDREVADLSELLHQVRSDLVDPFGVVNAYHNDPLCGGSVSYTHLDVYKRQRRG